MINDPGMSPARRLIRPVAALLAVIALGTLGYMLIEDWSFDDAIYMTMITIGTVGFGEVQPLSRVGRHFTSILIVGGIVAISYAVTVTTGLVLEGHLTNYWVHRRMQRRAARMEQHYVICGYGRVGRQIVEEFQRERCTLIVIDVNQSSLERAVADGLTVIYGNATEDDVLLRAGIMRARGLIAAVANDADNIFVTLSARALRPDMLIVARANYEDAVRKLRLAGANRVVSPYTMAGQQMAMLAVRPAAVDFVETLLRGAGGDLLLEDVRVATGSALVATTVATMRARFSGGATLAAIQRDGHLLAPPPEDLILQAGDVIAIVGTDAQLRTLERACEAPTAARSS